MRATPSPTPSAAAAPAAATPTRTRRPGMTETMDTRHLPTAPPRRSAGFTLMEMTMVVIILGLLAVAALPRVVDLHASASRAAAEGVAANLTTAFAMNYAVSLSGTGDEVEFVSTMAVTPAKVEEIIQIDTAKYTWTCSPLLAPGVPTGCSLRVDGNAFDPVVTFYAIATAPAN
jgi:prepilin-type N-terminal cleavage/methylation domain-containing protein